MQSAKMSIMAHPDCEPHSEFADMSGSLEYSIEQIDEYLNRPAPKMQVEISEKSHIAFREAAKKLGLSDQLPDVGMLRPDHGHWVISNYMMAVIIEADKDGELYDATDHGHGKWVNWHRAEGGYIPGSGGGFSYHGRVCDNSLTHVGARLSFNSIASLVKNAEDHPELWEIIKLNVKEA